ncbi:MAG: glycosyltransferase family 4 protein [Candidatus Kerfeldbacteria bacterium]
MKIGIITDSIDYNAQGIGRVIKDFCYHLSETKFAKYNEIVLIHEKNNNDEIYSLPNFKELIVPSKQIPFGREIRKISTLPSEIRKGNFDVIHDLANVGPFVNSVNAKMIQTVHDLTPVIFPSCHPFPSVYRTKIGMSLIKKNVDHYITVSNSTARDLHKLYKINFNKITTIYSSVSIRMQKFIKEQKNSINPINDKYILFVGTIEPRKNILGLLDIYEEVRKKNSEIKLIIAGKLGWKYDKIINKIKNHKYKEDIMWISDASDTKLAQLYNHAKLLLYPSFYEGFGLPVLEAIYAGVPVLASDNSSLPELVGFDDLLIDANNISEFSEKTTQIINDESLRLKTIEKLKSRLPLFSWEKNIRQTVEIYKKTNI